MAKAAAAAASFSATLAQHAGFCAVLGIVSASFDDTVCLEVTPAGISVNSVDKAQTSYLDAYFEAQGSSSIFRSYKCRKEHLSLYLHPKHLAKLLHATAGPSKLLSNIQLHVGDAEDRLTMRVSSLSKLGVAQTATYHMALLDATTGYEKVTVDGSEFEFTAEVMTATPAVLAEAIAQLKACSCQEVELSISKNCLTFASRGPDLPTECEIALAQHTEGGKLCLAVADSSSSCKFAFKFFERIGKLATVSSRVLLQMGTQEAPLSIIADLTGGGYVHMFLAPLVEAYSEE